jgi:hypothetical protein
MGCHAAALTLSARVQPTRLAMHVNKGKRETVVVCMSLTGTSSNIVVVAA